MAKRASRNSSRMARAKPSDCLPNSASMRMRSMSREMTGLATSFSRLSQAPGRGPISLIL